MTALAAPPTVLDASWLRALCLEAGAADVGFVELERPALADQRADVETALPGTRALISYCVRMNREPIRSPARSTANLEFHAAGHDVDAVGREIVRALEAAGVRALNPSMGFPMEMERFPGKIWVVGHKPVAVAAGLGMQGIHRNVIHPRFGNFVLLGTILVDRAVSAYGQPLGWNPCMECKLCVAACPVGAIGADGHFDFSACYTHNYREFMSGFTDWVEQVADAGSAPDLRRRVSDTEQASMWQSLSFGANYKAAYCLSVCPAGEEVQGPFDADRAAFVADVVRPLQRKAEPVYVVPDSDAAAHVRKRFPHKTPREVHSGLRPRDVDGFLRGLPLLFQRGQAGELDAVYHFAFTGAEQRVATVTIRGGRLDVRADVHDGDPDLVVTADTATWLGFLARERSVVWALLTRRIRLRGPLALLQAFGACFPA